MKPEYLMVQYACFAPIKSREKGDDVVFMRLSECVHVTLKWLEKYVNQSEDGNLKGVSITIPMSNHVCF